MSRIVDRTVEFDIWSELGTIGRSCEESRDKIRKIREDVVRMGQVDNYRSMQRMDEYTWGLMQERWPRLRRLA